MRRLLEIIKEQSENKSMKLLTMLDEENFGGKALVADDIVAAEENTDDFFKKNEKLIEDLHDSGVYQLDGKKIFCDILDKTKKIVICGAGHVSIPVIKLAVMLGCEVSVIEDREYFAENAKKAGATYVYSEPFEKSLKHIKGGMDTYYILLTRDHEFDELCLEDIYRKGYAYIGLLGSRKKLKLIKKNVIKNGIPESLFDDVHSPIGLDIQAESPVEIAISIMGEIIKVQKQKCRLAGFSKEILEELLKDDAERKAIVTLIERKGSVPRTPGTKMVVRCDESIVGTIGGGYLEAVGREQGARIAREGVPQAKIVDVEVDLAVAENGQKVHGASVKLLVELV